MLMVISPSKTQDFSPYAPREGLAEPELFKESRALVRILKKYEEDELAELMGISSKLAALNAARYSAFANSCTPENAKPALLAFRGDVYDGIEADSYTAQDFTFAQAHLRILSGLYGVLKPLDLIQPYRLEMGIALPNARGKDLYAFWEGRITKALKNALAEQKERTLINLASQEYFHAIQPEGLPGGVVTIAFKDKKPDGYKVLALFAKRARGEMANFAVRRRIDRAEGLKEFTQGGYRFNSKLSDDRIWVFTRDKKSA